MNVAEYSNSDWPSKPPFEALLDDIHCGDVLDFLRLLPDGCIHTCVTSPPYFALRNYGVAGQIGLEDSPQLYVKRMVEVFREVKRVLRGDGTLWLNLGDSYAGSGKGMNGDGTPSVGDWKQATNKGTRNGTLPKSDVMELRPKSLIGIPWRVAFALQEDGWILRSDIIWAKGNPMPESVTDRPTKSHEYVFLLAKSERYFYDSDAIREPQSENSHGGTLQKYINGNGRKVEHLQNTSSSTLGGTASDYNPAGRNKRSVWNVNTSPFSGAHFAVFPEKLIEPMILAGAPSKCCKRCGAGWEREIEKEQIDAPEWQPYNGKNESQDDQSAHKRISGNLKRLRMAGRDHDNPFPQRITTGFTPTCKCNGETDSGVVLDTFMGSGTSGLVAKRLGRHFIGVDLNPEYVSMGKSRLANPVQIKMFEALGLTV